MSTGHKAALARGRAESATVRHYLEALETSKPKRGRKRTPASIDKRLVTIESQLPDADALTRLHLLQEQKDLMEERSRVDQVKDLSALEKQFIKVAKAYGERKGITYATWRAAGVSAAVLQKAEISRARTSATAPAPAPGGPRRARSATGPRVGAVGAALARPAPGRVPLRFGLLGVVPIGEVLLRRQSQTARDHLLV
jgi:hypothetical protein